MCFFIYCGVFIWKKKSDYTRFAVFNAPFSLRQFRHLKKKFCIMYSGSWLSCTFSFHLCSVLLVQAKIYAWVWNRRASLTAKVILEICGSGQLSPLLKQQTASACQHLNLWLVCVCVCLCVRSSHSFRLLRRQVNITFFPLQHDAFFFSYPLRDEEHKRLSIWAVVGGVELFFGLGRALREYLCVVTTCRKASRRQAHFGPPKPPQTEINSMSSSTMLTQIR